MEYDFFSFGDLHLSDSDIKPIDVYYTKNNKILELPSKILTVAVKVCFERLSFTFSKSHLESLINATLDKNSSDNDRYVCASLLKNALIASEGKLPLCQDTGIANIFAWKDNGIVIDGDEHEALATAIREIYLQKKLRLSTTVPSSIFTEYDPKNNLPANIGIFSSNVSGSGTSTQKPAYRFLCCGKGGGSSNKTFFMQGTKANLNEQSFKEFLTEKIRNLGTSACPPYTIAVVVGGLSPEQNLLALKLATCGGFDSEKK